MTALRFRRAVLNLGTAITLGTSLHAYNSVVSLTYQQQTGVPRPVSIIATAGYLGSATNVTLALPNFTGVTGWDDSWGPLVGAASQWHLSASGGNFTTTFCAEGVRLVTATVSGAN